MAAWNFVTTNTGTYPQGYDDEDRFVHFAQAGQSKTFNFTRSDFGNINNINLNGSGTTRGFNNIHALTSIETPLIKTQVFNTDGNLTTSHAGHTNTWDEAGMMKQSLVPSGQRRRGFFFRENSHSRAGGNPEQPSWIPACAGKTNYFSAPALPSGLSGASIGIAGTNEYGYDADRKRVYKKITRNGSVAEHSVFVHAGPNLIAQYPAGTAAASPTQEYVYAQEIDSLVMLVRNSGNEKLTITRNQQWSVTALSDSANGNVLERYTYDHFGKRTILEPNGTTVRATSSYNMPFGYTSREHDTETGLMYFRARYYDPHTAEFTCPDPLEYVDGMSLFRGYFGIHGTDPAGLKEFEYNPDWLGSSGCFESCMAAGIPIRQCQEFCNLPIPTDEWPKRPPRVFPPLIPPGVGTIVNEPPRCGIIEIPDYWPHDIDWGRPCRDYPKETKIKGCTCSTEGRSLVRPPGGSGTSGGGAFIDFDLDCRYGDKQVKTYLGKCVGSTCDPGECQNSIEWSCGLKSNGRPSKGTQWIPGRQTYSGCKRNCPNPKYPGEGLPPR